MSSEVLVAIISGCGTLLGSIIGIIVSSKLTNYRIAQLEKKVDKHNKFGERIPVLEEKMKVEEHRTDDLEKWREKFEKV